jgi:hypothetical protein
MSKETQCLVKDLALALLPFYPETFSYEEMEVILTKANGIVPEYKIKKEDVEN